MKDSAPFGSRFSCAKTFWPACKDPTVTNWRSEASGEPPEDLLPTSGMPGRDSSATTSTSAEALEEGYRESSTSAILSTAKEAHMSRSATTLGSAAPLQTPEQPSRETIQPEIVVRDVRRVVGSQSHGISRRSEGKLPLRDVDD
jgi:hypothetical protein